MQRLWNRLDFRLSQRYHTRSPQLNRNVCSVVTSTSRMDSQVIILIEAFVVAVAFEALPRYNASANAQGDFIAALKVLYHGSKQFTVLRYAALGIERAARDLGVSLSAEIIAMFEHIKVTILTDTQRESGKSDWVVTYDIDDLNSQESRLSTLAKQFKQITLTS
ncbi:hypothetical protein KCU78_g2805, partial [Aureobasidium melanogenum]